MNDITTRLAAIEKTLNKIIVQVETLRIIADEMTDEPRFTTPMRNGLKRAEADLKLAWWALTGKERQ